MIEALKAIGVRHGWDQDVRGRVAARERVRIVKDRLIAAQVAKLAAAGVAVAGPLAADRDDWSAAKLERAAQELAARIREASAG